MDLKIKDIIKATNGNLIIGDEDCLCKNFCKDTRIINKGDIYIGIKGEHFDGNIFWKDAFNKGAQTVIINKNKLEQSELNYYNKLKKNIIQVEDTVIALGKMALYKRELYGNNLKVIGVTGSVGKTSTKDIIASVISQKYKTLKTEGNNNNNIGLPLTILRLTDEEVAVIEMGMNHLGEINYLSKIAKPDIAVITNIGTSHIGNLGSRENILKAKMEILDGMNNKCLILNNDNDMLNKWNIENNMDIETYTYGIENKSDVNAVGIKLNENSSEFICKAEDKNVNINVPVPGNHFILNSLCAFLVGKKLGLNDNEIIKGIKSFKLTSKRMEINKIKNNIIIINDAYNASYESMKASILSLHNMNGKRKIAVLGDMFELGDFSENLHRNVGVEVYKNNIDKLFLIGKDAKFIGEEAVNVGYDKYKIKYFDNKDILIKELKQELKNGDIVLIKASNGMKLYEVVQDLLK